MKDTNHTLFNSWLTKLKLNHCKQNITVQFCSIITLNESLFFNQLKYSKKRAIRQKKIKI